MTAEEAELTERNEEHYRAFIDNSFQAVWRLDYVPPLHVRYCTAEVLNWA